MRSRKKVAKKGIPIARLTLVGLVAVAAVSCGFIINSLVVKGYLWAPGGSISLQEQPSPPSESQEPPEEKAPEPPEPTAPTIINLRAVRFYLTQVGAVSTQATADEMVESFRNVGNAAVYHFDGALYRVYAGIFADKAAADAIGELFKANGKDAFTREVVWEARAKEFSGNSAPHFTCVAPAVLAMEEVFFQLLNTFEIDRDRIIGLEMMLSEAWEEFSQVGTTDCPLKEEIDEALARLGGAVEATRQFVETGDDESRLRSENSLMEFAALYEGLVGAIAGLPGQ